MTQEPSLEDEVVALYVLRGYRVQDIFWRTDWLADFYFTHPDGKRLLVRADDRRNIGPDAIDEFHKVMEEEGEIEGAYITGGAYFPEARRLALGYHIELLNGRRFQHDFEDTWQETHPPAAQPEVRPRALLETGPLTLKMGPRGVVNLKAEPLPQRSLPRFNGLGWFLFAIFSLSIGALVLVMIGRVMDAQEAVRQMALEAPFKTHINEYLFEPLPRRGDPYMRGRAVTLDLTTRKISPLFLNFPEELRAGSPDDVQTVIWLACGVKEIGYYDSPALKAYQNTCHVWVVDLHERIVSAEGDFSGPLPPAEVRLDGSELQIVGAPVNKGEMIAWLLELPARPGGQEE
ncbi:MAG TPA: restriction endonuclease [Anaerolineaceae bacterium]|nr:restriction endonuclease [Anaerolineaceae bacterium]HPN50352.1 restriction endonuclease [Anaerolineaceae bacterium]